MPQPNIKILSVSTFAEIYGTLKFSWHQTSLLIQNGPSYREPLLVFSHFFSFQDLFLHYNRLFTWPFQPPASQAVLRSITLRSTSCALIRPIRPTLAKCRSVSRGGVGKMGSTMLVYSNTRFSRPLEATSGPLSDFSSVYVLLMLESFEESSGRRFFCVSRCRGCGIERGIKSKVAGLMIDLRENRFRWR